MRVSIVLAVLLAVSIVPVLADDATNDMFVIDYKLSELFTTEHNPHGFETSSDPDHHSIKITWINDLEDGISIVSKPDYSIPSVDYGTIFSDKWDFDSGELKLGDVVTYIFDKPGWYAYYSKSYPDIIQTIRIYDTQTQCSVDGCDAFYLVNPPLAELSEESKIRIGEIKDEIKTIETEIESLKSDEDNNFDEIQDWQSDIDELNQELRLLAKNNPDCITLDMQGECVYETDIIENTDTPNWFKTVIIWYDDGLLTDDDFYYLVKYAIENNLIS